MSKFVSHPSFCFIAPTAYLPAVGACTETHLVLAHLVDTSPAYADFYKKRGEAGDFIMLDNSAYELKEPYSPEKLIDLATQINATAIVLPDYPFKPASVTIEAAKHFAPLFKAAGFDTFFVPQSQKDDLEDWIAAYEWAANNPDIDIIGMSILGIPNALPHIDPSYARVVMSQLLIDRNVFNHDKHHHYLGLNAGPALEIPSLIRMGALDTIDSSNPFWMAYLGHQYTNQSDSGLQVRKVNVPVDFNAKVTKDEATMQRIAHNYEFVSELFEEAVNGAARTWYAQE